MKKTIRALLTPLDLPLAFFLLAAGLSVIPALDRSLAWPPLLVLLGCGVLYAAVSRVSTRTAQVMILRIAMLVSAGIALFFVSQYGHYIEAGKVDFVTRLAQSIARLVPEVAIWQPLGNSMATLLEGIVFLCAVLVLAERQRLWRGLAVVSTVLVALALLLSESRGAWLAVVGGAAVWLALRFRLARWIALAALIAAVLLFLWVASSGGLSALEHIPVLGSFLNALFFRPDRLDVYRGSLSLIQDQPFTGLGLGGQFPWIYSRYVLLIQVPFLYYSHNFYLETWLQTGLIGMTAMLWLLSAAILVAWRLRTDPLTFPLAAGLAAVFIHGLTDARQYNDPWTWLPFFFLLALLASAWLRLAPQSGRTRWWLWLPASVPIFLLVVLIVLRSPQAAWLANMGSLEQARVEIPAMQNNANADSADLAKAEELLRDSIQRQPEQRSAHFRLGLLLTSREEFAAAVEQLEAALRASPANPVTHKALGLAYTWNGQERQAAEMLAGVPGIVEELNQYAYWRETQAQRTLALHAAHVSLLLEPNQPALHEALERLGE